jgi:hypothetical protein
MIKLNKILTAAAISLCSTVAFSGPVNGNGKPPAQDTDPAPTACSAGTNGLALTDVTYGKDAPGTAADKCWGVVMDSNVAAGDIATYDGGTWGGNWELLAKSDNQDDTLGLKGYDWDLNPVTGKSGTYTLSASPLAGLPKVFDFVAIIKASDRYAAYFFNDELFDGSSGGTWKVEYLNNGKQIPDISHIEIFGRYVGDVEDPLDPQGIPEPASLALVGLGLLAAAAARRKSAA